MKNSKNNTILEQRFSQLEERFPKVKKAMKSPTLARAFLLILSGHNWTEDLAKVFQPLKNKKVTRNPKIIAIHIRTLREARIIRRAKKKGRVQYYEPDWQGIADVFLLMDIQGVELLGDIMRDDRDLDSLYDFVIEKILKKYFDLMVKALRKEGDIACPMKSVRSASGRGIKFLIPDPVQFYPFENTLEELLKNLSIALSNMSLYFPKLEEKLKGKRFESSKDRTPLNLLVYHLVEQQRDAEINLRFTPEGIVLSELYSEFMKR